MERALAIHSRLGLGRHPFPPTPDPEAYYCNSRLECELAELAHCIDTRKGIMLVTGEVGLGKSTLLRRLLETRPEERTVFALVFNTFLRGLELLATICSDFGLQPSDSVSANLALLNDFLLEQRRQGRTCALLIDDAQNLDATSLELVRLLSNLETDQAKLLQIILCGQPELEDTLAGESLRQLRSRVVKHVHLTPLSRREIPGYVAFRVNAAGGSRLTLQRGAAKALYRASRGNPRRLHLILDRCLYGLVGRGRSDISGGLVRGAAAELGFWPRRSAGPALTAATFAGAGCLAVALAPGGVQLRGQLTDWWRAQQPALIAAATAWMESQPQLSSDAASPAASSEEEGNLQTPVLLPIARGGGPLAPLRDEGVAGSEKPQSNVTSSEATDCLARLRASHGTGGLLLRAMPPALAGSVAAMHDRQVCTLTLDDTPWVALPTRPDQAEGAMVRQAQEGLARTGLLTRDEVDGLLGPVTRDALRAYQQRVSLPVTGKLDALTLLALRELDSQVLASRSE